MMENAMPRSGKILAWFALISGVTTIVTPVLVRLLSSAWWPPFSIALCLALGIGSATGGYFGLKGKAWAFWLLFGVFLVQIAEYASQTFYISFIGPVALKFGWGWYSPPSHFNLNVLAILVCIFAAYVARGLTRRSSGPPQPASAQL